MSARLLLVFLLLAGHTYASTLETIVDRGHLLCGVSFSNTLFGAKRGLSQALGLDIDYCRAIAAAVFGDFHGRLVLVELSASERFNALRDRAIDVLVRTTTSTLGRDTVDRVTFSRPNFYDGQGFLVAADSDIVTLADLDVAGNTYCVNAESTSALNAAGSLRNAEPVFFDDVSDAADGFHRGECTAVTGDVTTLQGFATPSDRTLGEKISREPLAAATLDGDPQWAAIVAYTVNALVLADFYGVHKGNIDSVNLATAPLELRALLGDTTWEIDPLLGKRWARNAIAAVGNYGELYSRSIGAALPRHSTENALWVNGGLQYSEVWSGPSEPEPTIMLDEEGTTLARIRERGYLRCGVKYTSPLFAWLDEPTLDDGNGFPVVRGFDADFCHALALAVFAGQQLPGDDAGEPPMPGAIDLRRRLEFVDVALASERFSRLAADDYDVMVRQTTATLGRDLLGHASFARPNFYDGQGFMVRADSGIRSLVGLDLPTRTYCVARGTTTLAAARNRLPSAVPVLYDDGNVARNEYLRGGRCDAYTTDASQLSEVLRPNVDFIIAETISREPLAPVVSDRDNKWAELNRWVRNALVVAERYGVDRALIASLGDAPLDDNDALRQLPAEARRLLGVDSYNSSGLGDVHPKFVRWILAQVGNYGEVYERHLEERIPRNGTLNDLWYNSNGGILFAEPWLGKSALAAEPSSSSSLISLATLLSLIVALCTFL
jgi:general L-amino acid transport system substrate-binding protein